jgi:hypothetical protein
MAVNNPEHVLLYARIVARTWADNGFKDRFIQDPAGILTREYGIEIPKGLKLEVRQNSTEKVYVALDSAPRSEFAREQVDRLAASSTFGSAGSLGTAGCACGCFGTVACLGTAGSWDL